MSVCPLRHPVHRGRWEILPGGGGDGKIIGSVGVSGVQSNQDAQTAQAGIDALK